MDKRQCQTNGNRRETGWRVFVGCAVDHQQETCGQHNFNHDGRQHGITARRMLAEAVRGEAAGRRVEASFTAGNDVQNARCDNTAHHLSDNITNYLFRRKTTAGP